MLNQPKRTEPWTTVKLIIFTHVHIMGAVYRTQNTRHIHFFSLNMNNTLGRVFFCVWSFDDSTKKINWLRILYWNESNGFDVLDSMSKIELFCLCRNVNDTVPILTHTMSVGIVYSFNEKNLHLLLLQTSQTGNEIA